MKYLVYFLLPIIVSCSMLAGLATDAVTGGSKGGINTELVVGDKSQVLGTNQKIKAKHIQKVVGTSDNSVIATSAKQVKVINNTFPLWALVALIVLAALVGWLAPRPALWKRIIQRQNNDNQD